VRAVGGVRLGRHKVVEELGPILRIR
jgi:hypothetical protein